MVRHMLSLMEYTPDEIMGILHMSRTFKELPGRPTPVRAGRTLMLVFEKPSTRTRVSLTVAASHLGMETIYASPQELQLGRGETIADTARTLSRYVDVIAARVYRHVTVEELARHSSVPVINALSDLYHPLQALADALTIWEKTGKLRGATVAFVGDVGNNVARSIAVIGAKLGWEVRLIGPRELWPEDLRGALDPELASSGGSIVLSEDPADVRGVDVVYTDVWVSMGQEAERERRMALLRRYQVNVRLMEAAGDPIFMHCLPANRGMEVTDDVLDGPRSAVWDQAENRLHTAKAVLVALVA